jgi:hypothetical protein
MSVENLKTIDVVSIDLNGNAILTISDHLEWDIENKHLLILQNKINAYLSSIEEGDLYKSYPNAKDRNIWINVVAKYPPNKEGRLFLERIKKALEALGYGFNFSILKS